MPAILPQPLIFFTKQNMKIDPENCAFGIKAGKFLDFIVSKIGIEANP